MIPTVSMLGLLALGFIYRYLMPQDCSARLKLFAFTSAYSTLLTCCIYCVMTKFYEGIVLLLLLWVSSNALWIVSLAYLARWKIARQESDNRRNDK